MWRTTQGLNGVVITDIFNHREAALAFQRYIIKCGKPDLLPWAKQQVKSQQAVSGFDLPVGVSDRVIKSVVNDVEYSYKALVLQFKHKGKTKAFTRSYGLKRTRAEALDIVTSSANKFLNAN